MGFFLFIIEIILTILCFPVICTLYYYLFKNQLKNTPVKQQLMRHVFILFRATLLAILIANLIRYVIGISFSYFFTDSYLINTLGNLLWFTPHGNTFTVITVASLLNMVITYMSIQLYIRYTFKKSSLDKIIPRYSTKVAFIVYIPVMCWYLLPFFF